METKKCYKCNLILTLDNFSKDCSTKDGFQCACKKCRKQQYEQYRKENKNKIKGLRRKYYIKHKDIEKINHYKWIKNNKIKSNAYTKEYNKNYKQSHKKELNKLSIFYVRKRRAIKLFVKENYTAQDQIITLKEFEHKCFNCGAVENLCIDHHKPLSKGNPLSLSNAVVLCHICNASKGKKDPIDFYGQDKCNLLEEKLKQIIIKYILLAKIILSK